MKRLIKRSIRLMKYFVIVVTVLQFFRPSVQFIDLTPILTLWFLDWLVN